MLVEKYKNTPTETLLICGDPFEEYTSEKKGFITQVNHLPDSVFAGHLIRADKIVCRSGYSTIMDLKTLNCLHKAEFHPTPGQTEQEYLAHYLSVKGLFRSVPQQCLPQLDLKEAERRSIPLHSEYSGSQRLKSCVDGVVFRL